MLFYVTKTEFHQHIL